MKYLLEVILTSLEHIYPRRSHSIRHKAQNCGNWPWSWVLDLVLVLVSFSVSVSVAVSEIYESPRLAVTGYRLWVQGISMSVNTHNNC